MKRKATYFIIMALMVSFLTALCGCVSGKASKSPRAVENFDVARYMGSWYEIARLPQWFERNMNAVKAEYTLQSDGTVKIVKDDALLAKVRAIMPQVMDFYDKNGWEMCVFCLENGHVEIRGLFDVKEEFEL